MFTTGTATHHNDLLDKLRIWLTGTAGWTQLAWTAGATVNDSSVLAIRGPGAGAGKQVYINIRTKATSATSLYTWEMSGATDYIGSQPWGAQPNEGPAPYLNLWQNSIDYWFYANDRRFVVVAKMSTVYASCYCGFYLPWGTPAQVPFPLFIGGNRSIEVIYNDNNSATRFFVDPGGESSGPSAGAWCRHPDGTWKPVINQSVSNSVDNCFGRSEASHMVVWPWSPSNSNSTSTSFLNLGGSTSGQSTGGTLDQLVPTAQGERTVVPVELRCRGASNSPAGVLDGVFCPFGRGLVTEQTITVSAKLMRAFQNQQRNKGNSIMLIEEV